MERLNMVDKLILALIFFTLAMAIAPSANSMTLSAEGQGDSRWRIFTEGECKLDAVDKMSNPELRKFWKPAEVVYPNKTWKACWLRAPNGAIYFIFEDGDIGIFDTGDFHEEKSI